MLNELMASIVGTSLLGGSYIGLYKLGWYISRKEQENKIKYKIEQIEKMDNIHDGLLEYKKNLEEHLEKLNSHCIGWKKEQ